MLEQDDEQGKEAMRRQFPQERAVVLTHIELGEIGSCWMDDESDLRADLGPMIPTYPIPHY